MLCVFKMGLQRGPSSCSFLFFSCACVCVCVSAMLPVLAGRLHGHHEKREQHGVDGA